MMDKFPKDISNFKLLVSDFDGTLVGKDLVISPQISSAVKKWVDSGREFCIATGRQFLMIKKQCKELGIVNPVVARGGAEIVDPLTGKVIYSQLINKEILKDLLEDLKKEGFEISVEVDDKVYSDYYFRPEFAELTFKPLDDLPEIDVPKLGVFAIGSDMYKKAEFVQKILIKGYPQLHIVEIYAREGLAWDITSLSATKNLAVLELQKILNVERKDTIGVGDGYNDFPLMEACGLKVAMGNARDELKEIADIIVPSQEENGVAYLIDKLLK